MAEEEKNVPQAPAGKSPIVGKLITVLVVVLLAAGGGGAAYKFWVEPRLKGETAHAEDENKEEEKVPETAKAVPFDDFMVTVLEPDRTKPAPLLLFSMSLLCANEETVDLVERDKAYFMDMLNVLHSYKKREELDDPLLKESIKKEALRLANERLHKLLLEPNEEVKVLDVFHTKFTVVDQQ
jgi:flagellar FliL protein